MQLLERLTQPFRLRELGPVTRKVIEEANQAEVNERRDLADRLRTMQADGEKKHAAAASTVAVEQAAVAKARAALEAALARAARADQERSMIYAQFVTPLQAIRDELARAAPPEIQKAIQWCYDEEGTLPRLERYETIPARDDDINGKPTMRLLNGAAIAARKAGLRAAVSQLELLRWRYSEDVNSDVAAILGEVPNV